MKKITKYLALGCLSSALMLTGCIEETFPTSGATEEQVTSSEQSASAMLWAMHAQLNTPALEVGYHHSDFGYSSIMHIRDLLTNDMPISASNYDQFWTWEENQGMGESYLYAQIVWTFYYQCVLSANKMLAAFPLEESTSNQLKGYIAAAHAYRAMFYLDMARMYEYLPTDVTSPITKAGNDVTGLTVPIVTENTTEEQSYNNPRVSRQEMADFILSDLKSAEENIGYLTESSACIPHLDAVYGLYARLYMWLGQNVDDTPNLEAYQNAQKYARLAIDASSTDPMTQEECLSTSKGFNDLDCWMWGSQLVKENDLVQTGIINWVSWMVNENTFGYAGQVAGPWSMINRALYDEANDNDFRKRMWKAPEGSALDGMTDFLTSASGRYFGDFLPTYASVKFRPGEGNTDDVNLAAATAYPLMRVEEMYFIEAEAAEHVSPGAGKALLESFMNTYRIAEGEDYTYVCTNPNVVEEIYIQKCIELWGEGLAYYDMKRLNMPLDRAYEGSNFSATTQFVQTTPVRPAWLNFCITQGEKNSNRALVGYENPDMSGLYELK